MGVSKCVRVAGAVATGRPGCKNTWGSDGGTKDWVCAGVHDVFHVGHLNILRNARLVCDHLIAGVVTDDAAEAMKGRPPVVPLAERLEIVRSIRYVDEAVIEDRPTKLEMWRALDFTWSSRVTTGAGRIRARPNRCVRAGVGRGCARRGVGRGPRVR
jgi:cytidyltransferase-like protein